LLRAPPLTTFLSRLVVFVKVLQMNSKQFLKFVSHLAKNYQVYAPQEEDGQFDPAHRGQVVISELTDSKKAVLDNRPSFYSWKRFFVPEHESLFEYNGVSLTISSREQDKQIVLLGVNLVDLKSIILYDRVFANDPYYQKRRQNLLIVAHNFLPGPENNLAHVEYKEENLKQYIFDIFLARDDHRLPTTDYRFKVFVGSEKGEKILQNFGYKDYRRIECAGSLTEDRPGSKMNIFRDKLKNYHNPKIWEELDKRCIECGKCTIVCPTCFCFRIDDTPSLEESNGERQRCWDSCFYHEFSEIGGGYKFLKTTAERIHFWYYHKFARIPDEYSITGCVGCHRCHQVCPVGIDIVEVLKKIEES
jgi:sulfhydrogenase subunit beta (sulfur reductase)